MAVAAPFSIQQSSIKNGPSYPTEPFDVDLLCAKLEVAKLEQEAARARARLRQLATSTKERPSDPRLHQDAIARLTIDRSPNGCSTENAKKRFSADPPRKSCISKSSSAGAKDRRPESGHRRDVADWFAPDLGPAQTQTAQRMSIDEVDVHRSRPQDANTPKRKSVRYDLDTKTSDSSQRQSLLERPCSRDMANRRSKTFPLQISKLPLKHRSMSTYEYVVPPELPRTRDESPSSAMGLVNEYTISFDLADLPRDRYKTHQPDPSKQKNRQSQQKPPLPDALRSRSLLNLSALLPKKDRTQVQTEEVYSPFGDSVSPTSPRPLTSANGHHHARQQSLPIDFGHDSAVRLAGTEKKEKRRSIVAWLLRG